MKKITRALKRFFVLSCLDQVFAYIFHKTRVQFIWRLIPDRTFYKEHHIRNVRRYGVRFKVRPSDFSQWIIFADHNDSHITSALSVLKANDDSTILDIGANCGQFCLPLARTLKRNKWNKRIIAFEPNPRVYNVLRFNLSLNPSLEKYISLVNKGVGETNSSLILEIPMRNTGAGSLVRSYENEPHEKYEIEVVSLDSYFSKQDRQIEFIKIDVESFEYYVIAGAKGIISEKTPSVYMEIGEGQVNQKEIFRFFKSNGYETWLERDEKLVSAGKDFEGSDQWQNVLFTVQL